jgi:hypothetical protein
VRSHRRTMLLPFHGISCDACDGATAMHAATSEAIRRGRSLWKGLAARPT